MKKILFVCVYNSVRSQMAEGLARKLGGRKVKVYSAGLYATGVNPKAIRVMKEIGIDISSQRSKSLEELKDEQFDYIITLCSETEKVCPVLSKEAEYLHWPFPDPAQVKGTEEEILTAFRHVRDSLKIKLLNFLNTLPS